MRSLHEWLAILALGVAVVSLGVAVASWASGRSARTLLDRLILLQLGGLVASVLVGWLVWLVNGPPRDALHLLYGIVVFVPLPLARYLGQAGSARRAAGYLALGAAVMVGLIVRLFQTGG